MKVVQYTIVFVANQCYILEDGCLCRYSIGGPSSKSCMYHEHPQAISPETSIWHYSINENVQVFRKIGISRTYHMST